MARFPFRSARIAAAAAAAACIASAPSGAAPHSETTVLAGGCFWGMEALFEHVKGVSSVVSGYAGGSRQDANYPAVSSERTDHAEAIRITYDPSQISFSQLLKVYFSIAHDPTQLDRQGPDVGHSYRSAIFPQTAGQRSVARTVLERVRASGVYGKPVVTRIEDGHFFPAEEAHQDFVRLHPSHPYVVVNDLPKLARLRRTPFWKG
jgi:peptide-methionine (S)-S-oxide reductase